MRFKIVGGILMSVIEIENLVKKYGDNLAVDNLNLKIEKGRVYGFLGPNGAGKTTTMKMVLGLIPFSDGDICINGYSIKKDFEKNKGLVSTDYFAFPYGVSCQNAQDYLKSSSVKLAFSYNQNRHMTCNDKQYLLPRYLMFSNMPFPLFKWWIE